MKKLEEKIEEYTEALFNDLGPADGGDEGSEEKRADLFAQVQEHLHEIVLGHIKDRASEEELEKLHDLLDQEDYARAGEILKRYPGALDGLDNKMNRALEALRENLKKENQHG